MHTDSQRTRYPAVAGQFYTDDASSLQRQLAGFLGVVRQTPDFRPKALIAPHAGYIYSGEVAAAAYQTLQPLAHIIRRVVILSPAHRYGFHGFAWSDVDFFRTPLGDVSVDREALASVSDLSFVNNIEQAFEGEHALEVHLPFLQAVLKDFSIVPFIVGMTPAEQVEEVLERLWGGDETLIVISSDLSHFHSYQQARQHDRRTVDKIEQLDYTDLTGEDACGVYPLAGLLKSAARHQLQATLLDLRNSGDTAGPRDRVVGYSAFALHPPCN